MSDIELDGGRPRLDGTRGPRRARVRDGGARTGDNGRRNGLAGWIESRSGLGWLVPPPSTRPYRAARWRYALGAALVSCLAVEKIHGHQNACARLRALGQQNRLLHVVVTHLHQSPVEVNSRL